MTDLTDIKERLVNLKDAALLNIYRADSCKDVLKKAIKVRYPDIPDRANEKLASKLLFLDNDSVLQMGEDEIVVADLIDDIIKIIQVFMIEIDDEYRNLV